MQYRQTKGNEIEGHLDIFVSPSEDDNEVLIHGTPEGLRSFAKLLLNLAELNQEEVDDKCLPVGAREHYSLRPGIELSDSSVKVIVGRLDAKGTGEFYNSFIPKDKG